MDASLDEDGIARPETIEEWVGLVSAGQSAQSVALRLLFRELAATSAPAGRRVTQGLRKAAAMPMYAHCALALEALAGGLETELPPRPEEP